MSYRRDDYPESDDTGLEDVDHEGADRRRLQRLRLDRCRCHSRSEEPCPFCSVTEADMGDAQGLGS